jgi:hypothetical protein
MNSLASPRPRAVTAAAILAAVMGCYWLGLTALTLMASREDHFPALRIGAIFQFVVNPLCLGVASWVGALALWFRRNWGRALALVLAVAWIYSGWSYLKPVLRFLAFSRASTLALAIFGFPILAGIAVLPLLASKKIRTELLPPAIVTMYVTLLDEGAARAKPTRALALGGGLFELLATGNYDAAEEHWEIKPGSVVRGVRTSNRDGKPYLLAVALGSQ